MSNYNFGTQDFTGRIMELWRAGRPIHLAVGSEIARYGTAVQRAAEKLTEERVKEKKGGPVRVIFHDRYCGFYQSLPSVTPCDNKVVDKLGNAMQISLMSKEQLAKHEKWSNLELPFDPAEDIIFYFKSIDFRELNENPHVMTLLRNCVQSNMPGLTYVNDKKIGTRGKRMIVIVMATGQLPEEIPELKPEIIPLPDFETLKAVLLDVVNPLIESKRIKPLAEQHIERFTESLAGFTVADAEEAVALVWSKNRTADAFSDLDRAVDIIEKEKARIIAKTQGLEYVPKERIVERVLPGYEVLRDWVLARHNIPHEKLKHAGIMPLKGFAIAGSQGTGKTEICKYVAKMIHRILLIWNVGGSKSSLVGSTEQNTIKVIQLARALKAVVMLDDMDKSGVTKSKDYAGDGGTSSNQVGMILTEASDPFSPIIWLFTFNRLPDLPELFRPGRLDRCFYVERPNATTRLAILKEGALRAKMKYDDESALRQLADETNDYSPAEIIHVIVKDEVLRCLTDDTEEMQVERMLIQSKEYHPQFSIARFQQDIKEMEQAVSQFTRIGNLPENAKEPKTARGRTSRSME